MADTEIPDSGNESPCFVDEDEIVIVSDVDVMPEEPEENSYKVTRSFCKGWPNYL